MKIWLKPPNCNFFSQTALLILQFSHRWRGWVFFFHLQLFLTPMLRPGFEPTSEELHQTGTFRTLYLLSYTAAADNYEKLVYLG